MEITHIKDSVFKIKGKSGFATIDIGSITLESTDGSNVKVFKNAGEYEVAGISVIGIQSDEGNVFVCEVDGLRICHLGNSSKKMTDSKLSVVGDIDVLLVPVCVNTIEMVQQIESYYVIPYGYKTEDELNKFLNDSGFTVTKPNKFTLKKDDIIEDQPCEIVVI